MADALAAWAAPDPAAAGRRLLFVRRLSCLTSIGVHAGERGRAQPVFVDIVAEIDDGGRELHDDIHQVLDYGRLREAALRVLGDAHIHLAETACERIAALCLALPTVQAVRVRLDKPEAFADCACVGCEVLRRRPPPGP